MPSNFTEVARLNTVFGKDTVGWDWEEIRNQFKLVAEEFKETYDAIQDEDKAATVGECCDVLVTVYGLLHLVGVDADLAMKRVSDSNFSKLCITPQDLNATAAHYISLGMAVETAGELPEAYVRVREDCTDINGRTYPRGKFLKSVNYKGTSLEGVL